MITKCISNRNATVNHGYVEYYENNPGHSGIHELGLNNTLLFFACCLHILTITFFDFTKNTILI